LEVDAVLRRVLEVARELTGAQYAALGVLDERQTGLSRFLTLGIDEETRARIGNLPRGHGVLGELIRNPAPLRLEEVSRHPRSYGFPAGHPPMHTFLGAPIVVGDEVFGNLYLTEREHGSFSEEDEETILALAGWAGVAIANARRFEDMRAQRDELEKAVGGLSAMTEIAQALAGETNIDVVLELVAKRSRALLGARSTVVFVERNGALVIAAAAGEVPTDLAGARMDPDQTVAGQVLRSGRPETLAGELNRHRFDQYGLGHLGLEASAGVFVPLTFRGRGFGVLAAFDRLSDGPDFHQADLALLEAFAVSAGTAIATTLLAGEDRRQARVTAAESERGKWARELHDETLQGLAALKLSLSAARKAEDAETLAEALAAALEQIDDDVASLRGLITELRPAALDEYGTEAALETLVAHMARSGPDIDLEIDLAYERGRAPTRHTPELEAHMYRIVQESLNNAAKHAHATRITVQIHEDEHDVEIWIRDDGVGFDTDARHEGFGFVGMRERVEILDGTLEVESSSGAGTVVHAQLPARRRPAEPSG
jgi:signal transduction histidine kinase